MIIQVYAVYDSKARAFCLPFYAPVEAVAVRNFSAGANDATLSLCKHAEDFTLFHIGSFDDSTGELVRLSQHVNLGLAANFKERQT